MDNMDFEDKNESVRKLFILLAVLLFVIAACLFVYVFFFKNKDKKEEVKSKEESTTVIIEPKKEEKEEKKEEIVLKTDYDNLIESATLFDTIGNYSIYVEEKDGSLLSSYLVNNETKSIISSGSDSYVVISYIYNEVGEENECNLKSPSKCDYYVYHINDSEYFINKKDNVISLNSYKRINSYFLDPNGENLYLCEYNDDVIFTYNGDELFNDESKFGILNIKTGLEYSEPKFKYITEIGKDKFAGIIDSNVGLYNKNGEVILNPSYDFIGYIKSNNTKTYITINEDEVKFYDENLKSKKFTISDDMEINGLHSKYYQFFVNNIYKVDINENDSFKYEGTDITGEKNVIIFNPGCSEYDEETQKYKDTKDSLIYVVENDSLKKLDPSLVTPNDELCDNWF